MDTSETYIKMRLAAIPDLGMGQPPRPMETPLLLGGNPDYFNFQTDKVFTDAAANWYYSDESRACQLERQDQLQEMVMDGCMYTLLDDLDSFIQLGHHDEKGLFSSMEQLWLAFVMKEKYGKAWDGENWLAQKQRRVQNPK